MHHFHKYSQGIILYYEFIYNNKNNLVKLLYLLNYLFLFLTYKKPS